VRAHDRRRPHRAVLFVAAGLVAGCAVGPNFVPPRAPAVTDYEKEEVRLPTPGGMDPEQRFILGTAIARQWWELFQSPLLNDTLALALAGSPTLTSARATLAQAEEVVAQARAAYYPQLDFSANASRQYIRASGATSSKSGSTSRSASSSSSAGTSSPVTNIFSFGPLVSYAPDLFGRNRRTVEQQAALAENDRYQLAAAYLSLTAGAVTQALTVASTLAQIKAAEAIVATDEHNLELVRIEFEAGLVARTDVLLAESQLAGDQTLLPPLRQQLSVARHAFSVLVGKTPAQWSPPDFDLDALTLPAELPLTLPSQLIHERPDILAAEAQLHAASAAIGVATAQLYPSITLSAAWMAQTVAAGGPFPAPSLISSLAAGLTTPVFHGGALQAQRRAAIDAFDAQVGTYQQIVLQAFGQVADVLRALEHDAELLSAERMAVTTSEASLSLAQDAYAAGRGSLLQVLDAQRLHGQALLGYARTKGQRYLDTVQLFEAMGGAWQEWVQQTARGRR
jgi:NodT family efflux transporter outer membrane factor (OMF) lipoprotein